VYSENKIPTLRKNLLHPSEVLNMEVEDTSGAGT
jgi:hypothetical protein